MVFLANKGKPSRGGMKPIQSRQGLLDKKPRNTSSFSANTRIAELWIFDFVVRAQVMRARMLDLEARLEEEKKAREELQQQVQQLQEFMKNWRAPTD